MGLLRVGLAVFLMAMLITPAAQAEPRYAAPAGEGTACTETQPCLLEEAVTKAKNGDEVIVTAGSYPLGGAAVVPPEASNVDIHGDFGSPMPRITASLTDAPLRIFTPGSRIRYLEVVNAAPTNPAGIVCHIDASVERVVVRVSGKNATALRPQSNCAVRDSLLLADGQGAVALRAAAFFAGYTGVARNMTALATGPESTGVTSSYENAFVEAGTYTLDLRNSIAAGDGADIMATTGSLGPGNVVVANSNFDKAVATGTGTIFDAGANQTAAPLFVDAPAGDYREAPGSPTIDAGSTDQIGPLDLDGNPRLLGPAPDIGAYEAVPPPGGSISSATAAVRGQIDSLAVAPKIFAATRAGGAVLSSKKPPLGTTVSYSLTAAETVQFSVERRTIGRRAGKRCVTRTRSNEAKKKCALFKPVKGGFTHTGTAGANRFKFSGRLARALAPGSYRLTGRTETSSRAASFKVVK